jgi:uncharacterized protein YecE (DUF72 family)
MPAVRVGCSGWSYNSWKGTFYPERLPSRSWFEYYAREFDTVEVNATFYRLPKREVVARWAEQAPDGFCFTVKSSSYLTHIKRLTDLGNGIERFYERIDPLVQAGCLGPVLWQLPENFHCDIERLKRALGALPAGRHAFEFRHSSWFVDEVYELLRDHGVALVIGDHPQRPFQTDIATTDWRFVRMHFGTRGRRGNYSPRELDEWVRRLKRWRSHEEVFVYFNNDWEAFAPRNAAYVRDRVV